MLEKALELAGQGFFVFPLKPRSKEPAIKRWQEVAANTTEKITELWKAVTDHYLGEPNIGLLMGKEPRLIGLDIDLNHGADPDFLGRLPLTWVTKSGNGYHALFRVPKHWGGEADKLGGKKLVETIIDGKSVACVTIRFNGQYFVGAGSIHPDTGAEYQWLKNQGQHPEFHGDCFSPDEIALSDAPDFFLDALEEKPRTQHNGRAEYFAGTRHQKFVEIAVAMRARGHSKEEIVTELVKVNETKCHPPKAGAEAEINKAADWACENVEVDPKKEAKRQKAELRKQKAIESSEQTDESSSIIPLGFLENDYYFTSKFNRQIIRINVNQFSSKTLTHMMPLSWWVSKFPGEKAHFDSVAAISYLQQQCWKAGIFNPRKMRGAGAWNDEGKLVIHLGNRLLVDHCECDLNDYSSRYTYRLGPDYPSLPEKEATIEECKTLIEACQAGSWCKNSSGILLAGQLSLLRLCGALPWRPHAWINGPAGCGKSTIMASIVKKMGGEMALYVKGVTTEAGIRAKLGCDSRPVIFDESETNCSKSGGTVRRVLELARQASSEDDGIIAKGTPDGKGMEFRVSSSFVFASIRVNLTEEADLTRVTSLELKRPDGSLPSSFLNKLDALTQPLADRIAARMARRYEQILANYQILRTQIAAISSFRHGQQYGMQLAGYATLTSDSVITEREANALIRLADIDSHIGESIDEGGDEFACLDFLLGSAIRIDAETVTIARAINNCGSDFGFDAKLQSHGLAVTQDGYAIVSRTHPALAEIFKDTKWANAWGYSLKRLPGSLSGDKCKFAFDAGRRVQCVRIPLSLLKTSPEPTFDNGIV